MLCASFYLAVSPMYLSSHPWHSISYVASCALHGLFPACLQTRQSSLWHFFCLNGSEFCSTSFSVVPVFSTTFILKPWSLISLWYFFCSCDPGVAGTNITASSLTFLYQSSLRFLDFSASLSSFLHLFSRCIGLSPFRSAFCLAL